MLKTDVCIIGAGFSGLGAALKLSHAGYNVMVIEKDPIIGGLAKSFLSKQGMILESYHHINAKEDIVLQYILKFGLRKELVWKKIKSAFWYNNKPVPLTTLTDIIRFGHISLKSKLNLIKLGLYVYFKKNYSDLNAISAEQWLNTIVDKELIDTLFTDLVLIKYKALNETSASWLGEMLHEDVHVRRRYAYLSCGLQHFINCFGEAIRKNKGIIHTNNEVISVNKGFVEMKNHRTNKRWGLQAKIIVSSIPPPLFNTISKQRYHELNTITYTPVTCMCCGARENISAYYRNIFIKSKYSFNGFFKYTQLNPIVQKEHIYYFFSYQKHTNSQQKMLEIEKSFIKDINHITSFKPLWKHSIYTPYGTPFFSVGYKNPPIQLSEILFLTGVYREYPTPRTMNSALKSGFKTADYIIKKNSKIRYN